MRAPHIILRSLHALEVSTPSHSHDARPAGLPPRPRNRQTACSSSNMYVRARRQRLPMPISCASTVIDPQRLAARERRAVLDVSRISAHAPALAVRSLARNGRRARAGVDASEPGSIEKILAYHEKIQESVADTRASVAEIRTCVDDMKADIKGLSADCKDMVEMLRILPCLRTAFPCPCCGGVKRGGSRCAGRSAGRPCSTAIACLYRAYSAFR